ncbi:DUF305 domain-containing protein [Streptomyces hirsutus]|uniref:DUF305 domain-containing protein n=1 Tax=Streptomyces hirsutus TaxID=35620 RepID=A0ABZ1GZB0_9ACTN|nr:DUF305 domain-containing protein [Streptomyces hirsutus]WSD10728.1 DUF305 domain-containing protein [Streptomyces hirsutus]WTD15927.1 DUF305 domain-containing protein [Streptomyces hirsutus]
MTGTIMAERATDSGEAHGRRSGLTRWLTVGATALVAVVVTLSALVMVSKEKDQAAGVPAADSADAGFARDMAVHHQQAVEMSYIVRDRTADEDIRRLAYDIAQTQANQRGMLLGWLDLWELPKISPDGYMAWMQSGHEGHSSKDGSLMPGMATPAELGRLGELEDDQAEILYLQLMIDHHLSGVDMASACASQCAVDTEQKLAQSMVEGQQSEVELMTDLLKERGSAPRE